MRDVLIIGGGVIGALVGLELVSTEPGLSIELVDKDDSSVGASSHAGAIDSPYSWTTQHADLQAESWRWHDSVNWRIPRSTYRRAIELHWLGREDDREQLREVVRAETSGGAVPTGYGATVCLTSTAYVVDPMKLIEIGIDTARQAGLVVTRGVRIISLQKDAGQVIAVGDDSSVRRVKHVVLAMGPWITVLSTDAFSPARNAGLRVKRVHGMRLNVSEHVGNDAGWADPARGLFLFPRIGDQKWAMSIRHAVWDVDPDVPQPPHPHLLPRAAPLLDAIFGAGQWSVSEYRTFADTYTSASTPLVEHVADGLGTIVSGTHGSGVRLAPALAHKAAMLVRKSVVGTRSRGRHGVCYG
jgi:glycine/D-amino acid oxidase-like deaminating enzyme